MAWTDAGVYWAQMEDGDERPFQVRVEMGRWNGGDCLERVEIRPLADDEVTPLDDWTGEDDTGHRITLSSRLRIAEHAWNYLEGVRYGYAEAAAKEAWDLGGAA